jgi:hypothetical protein
MKTQLSPKRLIGDIATCKNRGIVNAIVLGVLLGSITLFLVNVVNWLFVCFAINPRAESGEAFLQTQGNLIVFADPPLDAERESWRESFLRTQPWSQGSFKTNAGGAVWRVRRYQVVKINAPLTNKTCLMIEIRKEVTGLGALRVVADVAFRRDTRSGVSEWVRIPWWEHGGLATANTLIDIKPRMFFIQEDLSFPTTTESLLTWIEKQWEPTTKVQNEAWYGTGRPLHIDGRELKANVMPELQRLITREFGHIQKSSAVIILRTFNGLIQWLTFAAFYAAVVILWARHYVFVKQEPLADLQNLRTVGQRAGTTASPDREPILKEQLAQQLSKLDAFRRQWGASSAALLVSIGSLKARLRTDSTSEVISVTSSFADLTQGRRDSQAGVLRYFIGALPALGFIGTVVGIGQALMGTGAVLSDEIAKQQSGVGTIALSLGLAFDTTLVALVLSLVVLFVQSWVGMEEDRVVYVSKLYCLDDLTSRSTGFDGTDPESLKNIVGMPPASHGHSLVQLIRYVLNRSASAIGNVLTKWTRKR